jgi:glyoxylase-like metal-dependent hydrolase (beta-lactamase superfamily II)
MRAKIQFFGYAGYQIVTSDGKHVIIDPYLNGNPVAPFQAKDLDRVDLLLITHNAYDHLGDAPEIIRLHNPGHADHRFRWMPSTHSGQCRPPDLTRGVQFFPEAGIGGRLASESVDGMLRNPQEHV